VSARVTTKQLEALAARINELTSSPAAPWTRDKSGALRANVGNYHLSGAYGGVCLHRMANEDGGVSTPLVYGHVSKRELFTAMRGFVAGLEVRP